MEQNRCREMNSVALVGFRPRDDRHGIAHVVGRHAAAVQQILQTHRDGAHAVGERREETNCSGGNSSHYKIKRLGCQCYTFGLVVLRESAEKKGKETGRKESFSWLVRSAAGGGMGWQSPKAPDVESARRMINPDRLDPNETAASKSHNISVRARFKDNSLPSVSKEQQQKTTTKTFVCFPVFFQLLSAS